MMLPKVKRSKKRKKHKESIMQGKDRRCYLCMKLQNDYRIHGVIHEHHVYPGANRKISEENGFKVYLCLAHHIDGPAAVHNNAANRRLIQEECQRIYEQSHTRQQFMELIGRNYLLEEGENDEKHITGFEQSFI